MTAEERPAKAAQERPAKASGEGKTPAPITVIAGPNGLTIMSEDLEALDEFQRLLTAASDESASGPVAVFYLKYAEAQSVAEDLDKILSGTAPNSEKRPEKSSDTSQRQALATGPVKITPDIRLNALLVRANRTDRETIERLLKVLDLQENPEGVALEPRPRMIPVQYAKAKDIADVLRQVYVDRLVVARNQPRQGRRGGIASLMRGLMGTGGGQGQNPSDAATRISIGVDTHTNTLVIDAADSLFEEVKQLVQQLDTANAEEDETVQVFALHGISATAVAKAMAAFGSDVVQTTTPAATSPNGANAPSSLPPWAARGYTGTSGGQRSMGNYRPSGGSSSPFQGFGGQRGSRYAQPNRPGG